MRMYVYIYIYMYMGGSQPISPKTREKDEEKQA